MPGLLHCAPSACCCRPLQQKDLLQGGMHAVMVTGLRAANKMKRAWQCFDSARCQPSWGFL